MKVTEQEWVKATAQAMARPDTIELFNNVPDSFDSFALFLMRCMIALREKISKDGSTRKNW